MTTVKTKSPAATTRIKSASRSTKKAKLSTMLARPKGATVAQIAKALEWQPHTIRAAISGLRKTGAEIALDRSGRTPTYKALAAAE